MTAFNSIKDILLNLIVMLFSGIGVYAIKERGNRRRSVRVPYSHKLRYQLLDIMGNKTIVAEPGVKFTVNWYIKNTGNFTWSGCYIKSCVQASELVPLHRTFKVPDTGPGQIVEIHADFIANNLGDYATMWKMYDADHKEMLMPDDYLIANILIR